MYINKNQYRYSHKTIHFVQSIKPNLYVQATPHTHTHA